MTDTTDQQRPYEAAVAMWTTLRGGDVPTFHQLVAEAAGDGIVLGVLWACLGFADVAVEHLSLATGVPADELVRQVALAVADVPTD